MLPAAYIYQHVPHISIIPPFHHMHTPWCGKGSNMLPCAYKPALPHTECRENCRTLRLLSAAQAIRRHLIPRYAHIYMRLWRALRATQLPAPPKVARALLYRIRYMGRAASYSFLMRMYQTHLHCFVHGEPYVHIAPTRGTAALSNNIARQLLENLLTLGKSVMIPVYLEYIVYMWVHCRIFNPDALYFILPFEDSRAVLQLIHVYITEQCIAKQA